MPCARCVVVLAALRLLYFQSDAFSNDSGSMIKCGGESEEVTISKFERYHFSTVFIGSFALPCLVPG